MPDMSIRTQQHVVFWLYFVAVCPNQDPCQAGVLNTMIAQQIASGFRLIQQVAAFDVYSDAHPKKLAHDAKLLTGLTSRCV